MLNEAIRVGPNPIGLASLQGEEDLCLSISVSLPTMSGHMGRMAIRMPGARPSSDPDPMGTVISGS